MEFLDRASFFVFSARDTIDRMNGICICVDRLHAGFVGAYGSTWVQTPALDRMAADGVVFDQFHVDSLELDSLYRSYWYGRHALESGSERVLDSQSLPALLRAHSVKTVLATDEPGITSLPGVEEYDERFLLPEPCETEPAQAIEATHLARCFAQLIQKVESLEGPFFLWCHLSSLGRVWDAPWEMRSRYAEADDPDPPSGAVVPCRSMETDEDPDVLLGVAQSYAGQITLLDLCIGALADALVEAGLDRETAMAVIGMRGMALGEHGYVGPSDERLDGEVVHVPFMIRLADRATASTRSHELVQPPDLYPTWLNLLTEEVTPPRLSAADLTPLFHDEMPLWRDRLGLAGCGAQQGVRTPAWYLTTGSTSRLFAKPDDRWEVNDVADRHADIAELLVKTLGDYVAQLSTADLGELVPLDEVLRNGVD